MSSKWRWFLSLLIFGLFLAGIEWYIGWATLLRPWTHLHPDQVAFAILLTLVSYALRSLRFYHYFNEMHSAYLRCFRLMLQHNLWNNLLPMRTGEISFPLLMKRDFDVPISRSASALAWFRLLDLHTLGLLAIPALGIWIQQPILSCGLFLLWLISPWILFRLYRSHQFHFSDADHRLGRIAHAILSNLPKTPSQFFSSWILTLTNWLVKLLVFCWVLIQFVKLPPSIGLAGIMAAELTSVLPINGVAGAGSYEG
ncbi:MAG: UPF0104 family protein, partial [Gammaproteobacteria bacterium]